jgi:hypothetical protein
VKHYRLVALRAPALSTASERINAFPLRGLVTKRSKAARIDSPGLRSPTSRSGHAPPPKPSKRDPAEELEVEAEHAAPDVDTLGRRH